MGCESPQPSAMQKAATSQLQSLMPGHPLNTCLQPAPSSRACRLETALGHPCQPLVRRSRANLLHQRLARLRCQQHMQRRCRRAARAWPTRSRPRAARAASARAAAAPPPASPAAVPPRQGPAAPAADCQGGAWLRWLDRLLQPALRAACRSTPARACMMPAPPAERGCASPRRRCHSATAGLPHHADRTAAPGSCMPHR